MKNNPTVVFNKAIIRLHLSMFLLCLSLPMTVKAQAYGNFNVTTTNHDGCSFESSVLTISSPGNYEIDMASGITSTNTDRIEINVTSGTDTVFVTLNELNINSSSQSPVTITQATTAPVKFILSGTNRLTSSAPSSENSGTELEPIITYFSYCGLQKSNSAGLVITGNATDTLYTIGNKRGSGIGSGSSEVTCNAITINGGTIIATGGSDGGAGIGGNLKSAFCSNIIIDNGTVIATGGSNSAGIGGAKNGSCSNIIISGGTVTASGGNNGAGIGGGEMSNGSNIIISGGTVIATGTNGGAGIGGGSEGRGSNIIISNGTVTAIGGTDAADIGNGKACAFLSAGNVISGGSVNADSISITPINGQSPSEELTMYVYTLPLSCAREPVTLVNGIPSYYGKNDIETDNDSKIYLYLPDGSQPTILLLCNGNRYQCSLGGSVIINHDIIVNSTSDDSYTINNGLVTLNAAADYTLSMPSGISVTSSYRIVVSATGSVGDTAKVVLNGVNIQAANAAAMEISNSTTVPVKIILSGNNTLITKANNYAGLQKSNSAIYNLTITGSLSDFLSATGGLYGAGIGGGIWQAGENITINGGIVNAKGGQNGTGIGGGFGGAGKSITINGGIVTAIGGLFCAGIGGGSSQPGSDISITGGTVKATCGNGANDIGSGSDVSSTSTNIVISGGSVNASSISGTPTNGKNENVSKYTYSLFSANSKINNFTDRPNDYGTNDMYSDDDAKVYVWLTHEPVTSLYTMSNAEYGTLCYPAPIVLTNGIRAYTISEIGSDNLIETSEIEDTIPAHTPVILWGEATKTLTLPVIFYDTLATPNEGLLFGTYRTVKAETGSYVLQKKNDVVSFYKVGASRPTVNAFRCWMRNDEGSDIQAFRFNEGSFTGIDIPTVIEDEFETKIYYDLNGQKITEPIPGRIYIVNGKKQLILKNK